MKTSVIRPGVIGLCILLLHSGCASIVFPLQQEGEHDSGKQDPAPEAEASTAEALAQYSMGLLESSGGDNEEALRRYEAAVANDPSNLTLRLELALAYFHNPDRFQDMFTQLEEVLRRDPDNLRALKIKALGLRIEGRHREALDPLQKASVLDPTESTHYLEIASVYSRLKEPDEAVSVLEKSLPRVTDRLPIFQALGELYIEQTKAIRASRVKSPLPQSPLAMMSSALEEFPEDPYLLTQYGDLLILHGKVEEAIDIFARIEALNPDDLMIRQKLAVNLAAVGNREKAIGILEDIASRQDGNTRILFYLAELYELDEQPAKAIETYQRILKIRPRSAAAYIKGSFLHLSLDQAEDARLLLEIGRTEMPDDPHVTEMLGYTYAAMSNHAEAATCFSNTLAMIEVSGKKPLMSNFYLNYAISRQYLDEYDQAALLLRKGAVEREEAIDDYIGIVLRGPDQDRRLTDALTVLTLVQDIIPDLPETRTIYGLLAFRADEYETALEQFERAERLTVEADAEEDLTAQFYFWLGASAERIKAYEKSEEYFTKAIQLQPDYADAHNYLAYMLAERGVKLDEAYDHVDVALAIEPDNAAYIDTRGWIYFRKGAYEKALADIQRAQALMADDPTIAEHMGDILHAMGRTREALPWWEKSLELDPTNELVREKVRLNQTSAEAVTPN